MRHAFDVAGTAYHLTSQAGYASLKTIWAYRVWKYGGITIGADHPDLRKFSDSTGRVHVVPWKTSQ